MAVTLVILSSPGPPAHERRLTFDGERIVVGRGPGCDMRLPDASVSLRHAVLRAHGTEYALVDEGSTNGTFVGDVPLSRGAARTLRTGDVIRLGRVWLEVRIEAAPPTPDLGLATKDIALGLVEGALRALGDETEPYVVVAEGRDQGRKLVLAEEGRPYSVGRGETCDLPLADPDASREHAEIKRAKGAVWVSDLGAKNRTWLGDKALTPNQETIWKRPTMLRIGRTVLTFEDPVVNALAQIESLEDEPIPADEPVEPPPSASPPMSARPPADVPQLPRPSASPPAQHDPVRSERHWTPTDVLVVVLAVVTIAMSVAGLVWLLKSG